MTRHQPGAESPAYADVPALALLTALPGGRVLLIGAGDPALTQALLARGCRVSILTRDTRPIEPLVASCERVVVDDAGAVRASACFANETFELVAALDGAPEHDMPEAAVRLGALLPAGGIALIAAPAGGPTGAACTVLRRGASGSEPIVTITRHGTSDAELQTLKSELSARMAELQQKHLELRHTRLDVAVKEAFIRSLRDELALVQARADAAGLGEGRAMAQVEVLEERGRQLALQLRHLDSQVQALRAYHQSAGFRVVEKALGGLRRVPVLYRPMRAIVRWVAGRAG